MNSSFIGQIADVRENTEHLKILITEDTMDDINLSRRPQTTNIDLQAGMLPTL